MSWSIERAIVGLAAGAAVAVQGVVDFLWPTNFESQGNGFPIPGCPDAGECRTHGCAGDCSESMEYEPAAVPCPCSGACRPPECDRTGPDCAQLWGSDEEHAEALRRNITPLAVSADVRVSAAGGGSPPSPSVACMHQKWESCWCGEHVSAEGTEAEVIRACESFRWRHSHRQPK